MKRNFVATAPILLIALFIVTACELSRPAGDTGDITATPPSIVTPPVPDADTPVPPTVPPVGTGPNQIDPDPVAAQVAPPADAIVPGAVLVKLAPQAAIQAFEAQVGANNIVQSGVDSLDQRFQQLGITGLEPIVADVVDATGQDVQTFAAQNQGVGQLYVASFSPDVDPNAVAEALSQDPNVEYSEPNYIAAIVGEPGHLPLRLDPNDQFFNFQWHMPAIQMQPAWDAATGQNVIAAVVDTGIDFNAPDLANTNRLPGYDFVNNDGDPTDDQGHGTHVAGTVGQSTNNSIGVTGVAFNAQLLPVKVLDSAGNGSYENIIKGITYAVNQGAKVINMSLAGRNGSRALLEAVQNAHNQGVVVVAAAGNSGSSVEFPAAYDEFVIAIGATRFDNTRSRYSNFGPELDLVAPGGDITVDQNNDGFADGVLQMSFKTAGNYTYLFFEGTSMASPHVAGLAALLLSRRPGASPAEIEDIMSRSALNLGPANEYGAGLIQAAAALALVSPVTPQPPTPTFTPVTPTPVPITPTDTPVPITPTDTPTPAVPITPTDTPTPAAPITPTDTPTPAAPITPTDTPTPAPFPPTDTPLPAGELLRNGDFETDEAWVFGDTPVRGHYDTTIVFSGNRSVKLGIIDGPDARSYTSVWQHVPIPAEAKQVELTAHIFPVSPDEPGTDTQNIFILNKHFRIIKTLSRDLSNSQTWETRTFDLSDLRGKKVYVYFGVFNRGHTDKPTAMYVDKVSLTWAR